MQEERRRFFRWPIRQQVNYKIRELNKEGQCNSRDISLNGINLQLPEMFLNDISIKLDIYLQEQGRVEATGRLAWQKESDSSPQAISAGINFVYISDFDKDKIFNYMFSNAREKVLERWWQGVT